MERGQNRRNNDISKCFTANLSRGDHSEATTGSYTSCRNMHGSALGWLYREFEAATTSVHAHYCMEAILWKHDSSKDVPLGPPEVTTAANWNTHSASCLSVSSVVHSSEHLWTLHERKGHSPHEVTMAMYRTPLLSQTYIASEIKKTAKVILMHRSSWQF